MTARANVGYGEVLRGTPLSRAYLLERLDHLLPGTEATGLRAHHLPLSTRRPPPARGRVLLAGDALSLINPFTGEGIFYAVLSGALAGAAAVTARAGAAAYADALRRRLGRHLRHSGLATLLTRQELGGRRGDPARPAATGRCSTGWWISASVTGFSTFARSAASPPK